MGSTQIIFAVTTWSSTFGPGAVAAMGALVIGAVTARWVWKGGTGSALDVLTKSNAVLRDGIVELRKELVEVKKQLSEANATIAQLQARTDVVTVITPIIQPLIETIAAHERKSEARHEATIASQVENTSALRELVGAVKETRT